MKAYTNGSGEIILQMTYPEAELLSQAVSMAASGSGCHRGADYLDRKITRAFSGVTQKAINEVEAEDEKAERKKK